MSDDDGAPYSWIRFYSVLSFDVARERAWLAQAPSLHDAVVSHIFTLTLSRQRHILLFSSLTLCLRNAFEDDRHEKIEMVVG